MLNINKFISCLVIVVLIVVIAHVVAVLVNSVVDQVGIIESHVEEFSCNIKTPLIVS